ncbi:hypothetical protein Zmor_024529 [Zophobas morio]|uniref:Uncharacterized protein n=1 Tax=Zophobas morio TaxID=2755281 RepID=A0AA38M8I9_9CUCU|nr:hypothetical protein Zmor_024529 [Zophobas morio]
MHTTRNPIVTPRPFLVSPNTRFLNRARFSSIREIGPSPCRISTNASNIWSLGRRREENKPAPVSNRTMLLPFIGILEKHGNKLSTEAGELHNLDCGAYPGLLRFCVCSK